MQPASPLPWYKQFWPWLILFFPASAVVAGIITVIIAFDNSDTLVKDNWYKDGLAINQQLDKQNRAKELDISALVKFNRDNNQLTLSLTNVDGLKDNLLDVSLIHPTQPEKDKSFQAFYTPLGVHVAQLSQTPTGYFHMRINSISAGWQLNGDINFSNSDIESAIRPR